MHKIYKRIQKYNILLYLIFGVLSTIVSVVVYVLCTRGFSMGYYLSNAISWICAVTFAFITNRKLVFDSKADTVRKKIKEITLFYIARVITLIFEFVLLYTGIQLLKINDLVVKIIANVLVIILNYTLSKFFVFLHFEQKVENDNVKAENINF